MADEWKDYLEDPRTACKFASKCYQKNPEHRRQFKHAPQNIRKKVNRKRRSPNVGDSPLRLRKPYKRIEKPANDNSNDDKKSEDSGVSEDPGVSRPQYGGHKLTILPENISFYDKSSDNTLLKELFLVEMPEDFFKFFDCISECGKSVEDTLASVNLVPIGPYDLLLGKLPKLDNKELYLSHWRFFYDPPEFQVMIMFIPYKLCDTTMPCLRYPDIGSQC